MKKLWRATGVSAFWLSWPLLYYYLRNTRRTRVLIICDNETLVVKNWLGAGKWTLPGGGVKPGESSVVAALREVKEELGVTLMSTQLELQSTSQYRESGIRFTYDAYIVVLPQKPAITIQKGEIADAAWLKLSDISKLQCGTDVITAVAAWSKSSKLLK